MSSRAQMQMRMTTFARAALVCVIGAMVGCAVGTESSDNTTEPSDIALGTTVAQSDVAGGQGSDKAGTASAASGDSKKPSKRAANAADKSCEPQPEPWMEPSPEPWSPDRPGTTKATSGGQSGSSSGSSQK